MLLFGFFNATTWMVALGTPMVLLAGELGASSFQVGLAYAFVFLLLPVQILATYTLPRFGYKQQAIFGWSSRGFFLLIPLGLAWLAPQQPQPWMVSALVASAFFFAFFRSTGSCALMPLFYHNLPEESRGRYFSTDQSVTGISGIFTLIFGALLFTYLSAWEAFVWQYAYAIIGSLLTVYFLKRIPDAPRPDAARLGDILSETPRLCRRPSPFRQYLIFMVVNALIGTAFIPLITYYLKVELAVPSSRIMMYTAFQYGGAILGTVLMRSRIDAMGAKTVFRISVLASAGISAYWILVINDIGPARSLLPLAYFAFGVAISNWVVATLKYLPGVCSIERQALHVSINSAIVGLIGGLAPMLWGYLVRPVDGSTGVNPDTFTLYFAILMTVQIGLFLYVPQLNPEHRESPSLQLGSSVLRPFRYVGQLVNLYDPRAEQRQPPDSSNKVAKPQGNNRNDPNN